MKTEIVENEFGLSIDLKPETLEEAGQLMRFAKNAKMEKPSITYSFDRVQYLNVWMRKVAKHKQSNRIK